MMPLSTKGRYAARIMVCLAARREPGPATNQQIGEHEGISPDYVQQIMMRLQSAQLVRSHRGRKGGFSLTRDPTAITLAEVLQAVEGPVCPSPCLFDKCEREPSCPTRPVWKRAAEAVEQVLTETTIAQLAERPHGEPGAELSFEI